jgi:predicted dehydrogenase
MPERVHIGVIGTSGFADLLHLPNLKSHPRAKLAAICGRNRDRADEMASKYDIPRVFTDYRDMIEKGELHAVVIITPDDLHYPMTMAALDAGLHVLCEKPMALNATQAREMYKVAETAGVKHMVFFTHRWSPYQSYLKQLVEGGYIGRCYHCQIRYLSGGGRQPGYGWRSDRQRSNGVLSDLGSHAIDWARWYAGDIARVSGHLATFVDRPGLEGASLDPANNAATLLLEFETGAQGIIQVSAVAHVADRGQEQHIILHGESGTLELEISFLNGFTGQIRGARQDEEQIGVLPVPEELWGDVDPTDPSALFEIFLRQSIGDRLFIDGIVDDRPVTPSFYDGLKAQEVIDAAIESHRSGNWVAL